MANNRSRNSSAGRRTSSAKKRSGSGRKGKTKNTYTEISPDIVVIISVIIGIFLFLCNINKVGKLGTVISGIVFGLFGISAYVVPFLLIAFVFFYYLARENYIIRTKLICCIVMFCFINIMFEEIGGIVKESEIYSA